MTVSSPHHPGKRKYTPEATNGFASSPHDSPYSEISPRVIKKLRPKTINPQVLKGISHSSLIRVSRIPKTESKLFEGQRHYDRGEVDIQMTSPEDGGRCAFCDRVIEAEVTDEERTCLQCARSVCGQCGVRQYLHDGDFVLCLECVQHG